jgi:tRNA dimethylallyltransferase
MNCLISIVGPTAIGKTRIALRLADRFHGEIINADSRQIYKYMDVGTAKPDEKERAGIPYHLVDIIEPDEPFSLAVYLKSAHECIADIHRRNFIPLLVGGSGLYIWSVLEGWQIPEVPPDAEIRKELQSIADKQGTYSLFEELARVDPVAARSIMPTNTRRIIRALEIYRTTGRPASEQWSKKAPSFPMLIIGLTTDRQGLYSLIDNRVDEMIQNGLVEEVKRLIDIGYSRELPSMSGIGYRQIYSYIKGDLSLTEATSRIKYDTHRFARHQYAWFRLNDERIHWYDVKEEPESDIICLVEKFIADDADRA